MGIPINDEIYWVGANDYETNLFEAIWPLPRGVSYNSYLILDEKIALIDSVKGVSLSRHLEAVKALLPAGRGVDFLVVNHMEPDHSGSILAMRGLFPQMQIVGNAKTAEFLQALYDLKEGVRQVADGEVLKLGRHALRFFLTPMVHWPETMMSYDETDKVLFSGDAFGGFGALPDGIFDDQVDLAYYEDEILRYFSNIIGKYCAPVQKAIARLADLEIAVVAPTHGPVWRKNPAKIVADYDRWSRQETEKGVTLVYGSMYGNTEKMAEAVARGLAAEKVEKIRVHNISRTHASFVLTDVWRYGALVLGGPTYNARLFPLMSDFVELLENLRPVDRFLGIFGTYGWSGGGVKALRNYAQKARLKLIEPVVEAKFCPKAEDCQRCEELGRNLAKAVHSAPE